MTSDAVLTEDDWSAIYDLAQNLWSVCQRWDEDPQPPTDDDRYRFTAAAAIALGADYRGGRKEDFRDVARACAALGGFDLALKDDIALQAHLEYLKQRFEEEDSS